MYFFVYILGMRRKLYRKKNVKSLTVPKGRAVYPEREDGGLSQPSPS